MSYSNFLDSLSNAFVIFVNGLVSISNSLMSNYFFITILGLVLFCSLFWLVYDTFGDFFSNKIEKYYKVQDLKERYDTLQHIKFEWQNTHRDMVYANKFDNYDISQKVRNMWVKKKSDLAIRFKYNQMVINRNAAKIFERNFNDKTGNVPKWFNQDIKSKPLTADEKKELDNLIKNF